MRTLLWASVFTLAAVAGTGAAMAEPASLLAIAPDEQLLASGSVLRTLPRGPDGGWIAYDFAHDKVTVVDQDHHQVAIGSFGDYCAAIHSMLVGRAAAPEAAPSPPHAVTVRPEGDGGVVAGQPTQKYSVLVDQKPYQQIWVAPALAGSLGAASLAGVKLASCATPDSSPPPEWSPAYQAMAKSGLIVRTVALAEAQTPVRDDIISITASDTASYPADPPQGWPLVTFADLVKGR